jgi:polar amino acid transport system substrate-binding protein
MLFFCLFPACFPSGLSAAPPRGPFRIASEEWPPYEYLEAGKATGINVEVVNRIFARLKIPVDYQIYPFARCLLLAEKGGVDAVSGISYQPYRDPMFFFTEPQRAFVTTGRMPDDFFWNSEYVFFLERRHAGSFHFESYAQIKQDKFSVGVVNRYSYNQEFTGAQIGTQSFPTPLDAFQALDRGEVDLVPMDRIVGQWILNGLGAQNRITCLPTPLFTKPYLLAFTRASKYPDLEALSQTFYAELRKMRASGEYESIYETYIKPDYLGKITRPLTFVCEEWAPYEYLEGETVVGVDAAVVDRIMKRLGIPYQISIYPWSRAWMLAEKGQADAVLSVSYKDSRESALYYTDDQRKCAETGGLPADYLWQSEYVFFVMNKTASIIRFESYEQLKAAGVRIGINRNYSYDAAFRAAEFEGLEYPSTEEGLRALTTGEIDLYPMDKTVGHAALHRMGLQDSITWLAKPLFTKPYLSPFCKKSDFPELERIMRAFYRELRLLRANGEYDRIYNDRIQAMERSHFSPK